MYTKQKTTHISFDDKHKKNFQMAFCRNTLKLFNFLWGNTKWDVIHYKTGLNAFYETQSGIKQNSKGFGICLLN